MKYQNGEIVYFREPYRTFIYDGTLHDHNCTDKYTFKGMFILNENGTRFFYEYGMKLISEKERRSQSIRKILIT